MTQPYVSKWTKIKKVDIRVIFLAAMMLYALALYIPYTVPVPIMDNSNVAYQTIIGTPKGGYVLDINDEVGSWLTYGDVKFAWDQQLLLQGCKLIEGDFASTMPTMIIAFWAQMQPFLQAHGFKYGVDYVILPYIAGYEIAYQAVSNDLRSVATADVYGTPFTDLPIMAGFNSGKDLSLILDGTTTISPGISGVVRQFVSKWHTPYVTIAGGVALGTVLSDYQAHLIAGYFNDIRGCVEAEELFNYKGVVAGEMNCVNFFSLGIVILVVIGNVIYFLERRDLKAMSKTTGVAQAKEEGQKL